MKNWFSQPQALVLFSLLPVLILIGIWTWRRRNRALGRLGNWSALIVRRDRLRWLWRLCWLAGLGFLVLGIAGPQWGRDPNVVTAPGRDLVLVLDMSQSMLAQDVLGQSSPDRLGRARDGLLDLVRTVAKRGGDRLAVVVFAARPKVLCPLTQDYDHVRQALLTADLEDLLPDIGATAQGPASGTRIGAALQQAAALHDSRFAGYQDILIISDGDDPAADEEWRVGIDAARDGRIPIHTIGVGDPNKRSPILIASGVLRHGDVEVTTRLQEEPLQTLARTTGGTYTPAQTKEVNLGDLYRTILEAGKSREMEEDRLPRQRQRYAWFFAAALGLLALGMLSPRSPLGRTEAGGEGRPIS